MAKMKAALQMYTLGSMSEKDFLGTCRKVAQIGYQGIELLDMRSALPADELRAKTADMGLSLVGVHVGFENLESNLPAVLDYYTRAGLTSITCPSMPKSRRQSGADWATAARKLSDIGAACRQRGVTLAYHNHDFEFQKFDGKSGFDILLANSDAQNLKLELDTFWVQAGGEDPVAYLNRHAARVALLHAKDMAAGSPRRFAPVGSGILNWKALAAAAEKANLHWWIVEQDNCYETPPLDAVRISLENLKKMALV